MVSEPKTPPLRDSEPILGRAAPLFKTADAAPVPRGAIPDTVKPLIAVPVRNAMAGEQPTKLPMSEDADDLALPRAAAATATIGSTAVPVRPDARPKRWPRPTTSRRQGASSSASSNSGPAGARVAGEGILACRCAARADRRPPCPAVAAKEPPRSQGIVIHDVHQP